MSVPTRAAPSIWQGTPQWHSDGTTVWSQRHDSMLREAVDPATPLVLVGRNSGASGRAGALAAAEDLHGGAEALAQNQGWDVRGVLPSTALLATYLMESGNVTKSVDSAGNPFVNRFCLIDLRAHGIVLSISAGSALKLDDDYNQPHMTWLFKLASDSDLNIAGFFFKRDDRMTRHPWAQGKLLQRLRDLETQRPIWVGDGQVGRWNLTAEMDVLRFFKASGAGTEATVFESKRKNGQRAWTDRAMVDFKVQYALGTASPPGTFRFQQVRNKRWVLAIDTPSNYPAQDECASLLPSVTTPEGTLADQAATVQWFLHELGRSGRGLTDLWPHLIARGYSTETLRALAGQGPTARYGGPSKPVGANNWNEVSSWSRSLINNLDFYETGVLRRSIGPAEEPLEIANCFPPGGAWAAPEDFARIREHLRRRSDRSATARSWSWTGVPIEVNGVGGKLAPPRGHQEDHNVRWSVDLPGGSDIGIEGNTFCPTIPDVELTDAIMQALVDSDGRPLQVFIDEESSASELDDVRNEYQRVELERAQLHRRVTRQRQDAYAEDAVTGELQLSAEVRAGLLRDTQADEVMLLRLKDSSVELNQRMEILASSDRGVVLDDLQAIVDGLRNPKTSTYRTALREAVTKLTLTVRRTRRGRLNGYDVHLSGLLTLQTTSGPHSIPFARTFQTGAVTQAEAVVAQGIAQLRAGLPVRPVRGSLEAEGISLAWLRLGVQPNTFALRSCLDVPLLRVGMAALFPNPIDGEAADDPITVADLTEDALVAEFGDVERFDTSRRVRRLPALGESTSWHVQASTPKSSASGRCGWSLRFGRTIRRSGPRSVRSRGSSASAPQRLCVPGSGGPRSMRVAALV